MLDRFVFPDLPLWAWVMFMAFMALAIIIPFRMLIRIKGFQRLRDRAAAQSRQALIGFWVLVGLSYLLIVWTIILGYLYAWFQK